MAVTVPGRPCIRSDMDRSRSMVTVPGGSDSPRDSVSTRAYTAASALSARSAAVTSSRSGLSSGCVMPARPVHRFAFSPFSDRC